MAVKQTETESGKTVDVFYMSGGAEVRRLWVSACCDPPLISPQHTMTLPGCALQSTSNGDPTGDATGDSSDAPGALVVGRRTTPYPEGAWPLAQPKSPPRLSSMARAVCEILLPGSEATLRGELGEGLIHLGRFNLGSELGVVHPMQISMAALESLEGCVSRSVMEVVALLGNLSQRRDHADMLLPPLIVPSPEKSRQEIEEAAREQGRQCASRLPFRLAKGVDMCRVRGHGACRLPRW